MFTVTLSDKFLYSGCYNFVKLTTYCTMTTDLSNIPDYHIQGNENKIFC